jgi:F0F1-type ATP synthase assembly protein I
MIDPNVWRQLAPALGLVTTMTGSILAGVLLGAHLDERLGTGPVLTALLALAGLVSGALYLSRSVRPSTPDDRSSSDDPPDPPAP